MSGFPVLRTQAFEAYISDNRKLGIHRAGFNGVAALIRRDSGNNLFVPATSGLNYEAFNMRGAGADVDEQTRSPFEPRSEPMSIEHADTERVTLFQPETRHSHVSARITFR